MSDQAVTMYTTQWCGYCIRLKSQLERAKIPYTEIDLERDPTAAAIVERLNNGNQTVPTVIFPDGSSATNPSIADISRRLGR